MKNFLLLSLLVLTNLLRAQENKFEQLGTMLPTPNVYRTASGAPGHLYWQQKADYDIKVELDDVHQKIKGYETITYHNNSPDHLEYLWVQLDQNLWSLDSDTYTSTQSKISDPMTLEQLQSLIPTFEGGYSLEEIKDATGRNLSYTVVKTMMRINLAKPLKPGEKFSFSIRYSYNINDRIKIGGRSGYEYFPEDDNYLYTIAQFFPRMAVYIDDEGWQNKQFLGQGEYALPFGDYTVAITVPDDHLVAATGELQNPEKTLTPEQYKNYILAKKTYDQPVIIATQEAAIEREKKRSDKTKTWTFKATNVRDFAFATSRKFIWDAMAVKQTSGADVLAMSMYPKEGNPLWERYSTKAVAHTLKWYTHYTFNYPYPVAWSIHADRIGMEYPMICFNFGRPEKDGTYSARIKYGMISVIIHEVGHNYFPMIVNSDERQWTWMDEGLNSFLQYLTEQQWERDYPSRRGPPQNIVDYMSGDRTRIRPIMTNSESVFQLGNNAYGKPATALNILRETIMGRELFDYAFKIYSNRWKFKHPSPADFFRTMEDASSIDLDWFWRGWFYTTDPVDLGIKEVNHFTLNTRNPTVENSITKSILESKNPYIGSTRNKSDISSTQDETDRSLRDFYTEYDPLSIRQEDDAEYQRFYNLLTAEEKKFLDEGYHFYEITFNNKGGLLMPIILEMTKESGDKEVFRIPAEIWKLDNHEVTKVFILKEKVTQIELDPFLETADIDRNNNYFPSKTEQTRFNLFKQNYREPSSDNLMRKYNIKD
jgi:hypothetical protein